MNRKILQKVLDALSKESPDLSYVKGILETVIESLPDEGRSTPSASIQTIVPHRPLEVGELSPDRIKAIATIASK